MFESNVNSDSIQTSGIVPRVSVEFESNAYVFQ